MALGTLTRRNGCVESQRNLKLSRRSSEIDLSVRYCPGIPSGRALCKILAQETLGADLRIEFMGGSFLV